MTLENGNAIIVDGFHGFQCVGAPHSALLVRHFQDDKLEGAFWPILSPYLYPLDFFIRPFNRLCNNSKANHYI